MIDKNIQDALPCKWEFNQSVASCFSNMLERSIPDYQNMRSIINNLVINTVEKHSLTHMNISDLGCSNGESLNYLIQHLKNNTFHGFEKSTPMYEQFQKRFEGNLNVYCHNVDISEVEEFPKSGVVLSVLTLQFIPIEYRQKIVNNVYNSLNKEGVFIFVEKILDYDYNIQKTYEELYYDFKFNNGYSIGEIDAKREKLVGVLSPVTHDFNVDLLESAGFKTHSVFWKSINFEGIIAYK